jgi:hypothetical protein
MKKNIPLLLAIFIIMQLPVLLNAQVIFLKLGNYTDLENNVAGYGKGTIEVGQVGSGAACNPCTVPTLPKPVPGTVLPQKIVFNMLNGMAATFIKQLLLSRTVTTSACFAFAQLGSEGYVPYNWIVLQNVVVEEVNETSSSGNRGFVQVTLAYRAVTYYTQTISNTGQPVGSRMPAGWDFGANRPVILPIPGGL